MANERNYYRAAADRGLNEDLAAELRRTRGLTSTTLRELPERALNRAVRRLDYPDLARRREAFRLRTALDDEGRVPRGALPVALRELDGVRARDPQTAQVAGIPVGREVPPAALLPRLAGLGPGAGPA